nr:hypothetical protein [Candidatus Sigynarchaeota archaeon]
MKLKNQIKGLIIGIVYVAIFAPLVILAILSGIELETSLYILMPGFFGLLLALFIYQVTTRERSVPFLIVSLVFGVLSGIFAYIDEVGLLSFIPRSHAIMLATHMSCGGLQFYFFFLFIEDLRDLKPNPFRLTIATMLAFLQVLSLWLTVWFEGTAASNAWLLADIGYNNLALFTFLGCGLPVYVQTFKLTKEGRSLTLAIAVIIVGAGFVMSSIKDYNDYFFGGNALISEITQYGNLCDLAGLALFSIVYVSNVDYVYRLPMDNYVLMVSLLTGETVHFVKFKTRTKVEPNQDLLSGLLSTINAVFQSILATRVNINSISSKRATLLMESGKWVTATVITEKPSAILDNALKRYILQFEKMFYVKLNDRSTCTTDYDAAKVLLKKMFPFIVVDEAPATTSAPGSNAR